MKETMKNELSVPDDSIEVKFKFPNITYEKLMIHVFAVGKTIRTYTFIFDNKNTSINIPKNNDKFSFDISLYDPSDYYSSGIFHGIRFFRPSIDYLIKNGVNSIEITIPGINDAFFYKYYFNGDYARISENSVTLKGITYKKRK